MTAFATAWAVEVRKATRSRIPAVTLAVFTVVPAVGALFMFILANPDRARRVGLLNQKAQLSGFSADWSGMLSFATQAVAVGSLMLFAFIATWLFGREFADGTARYLMALPISRTTIVAAKLTLLTAWAALLTLWLVAVTFLLGWVMGLPGWTAATGVAGVRDILTSAALMIPAILPIATSPAAPAATCHPWPQPSAWSSSPRSGPSSAGAPTCLGPFPPSPPGWPRTSSLNPASIAITLACGALGAAATIHWWRSPDAGL